MTAEPKPPSRVLFRSLGKIAMLISSGTTRSRDSTVSGQKTESSTPRFHECIEVGDCTLSEFLRDKDFTRHVEIDEFIRQLLAKDGRFEIRERDEYMPNDKPRCEACKELTTDNYRTVIHRTKRKMRVMRRFRAYLKSNRVVCVVSEFGYANPYQW